MYFTYIIFFHPIVVVLVFLVCRFIIIRTNATKRGGNSGSDVDTDRTDYDIQPTLPDRCV